MTAFQTDYQSLVSVPEDSEVTPDEDVIFHVSPEKSRWNHIEDLDSFFRKCYYYLQQGGFSCIIANEFYNILQIVFIVCFPVYVFNCVDYTEVNHREYSTNSTHMKVKLPDLFIPIGICVQRFNNFTWFFIIVAILFGIYSLCRSVYQVIAYYEIKIFYTTALKIMPAQMESITWHEIQCKLREVQKEQLMCIHKQELSELDIYHRILRHENYMIAMMNKNIFPVKYNIKFYGDVTYFPPLLLCCLEFLLFRSPFAPFKSTWQLKEEYKKFSNRHMLAEKLSLAFLIMSVLALLLCVFIFIFQLLFICVSYAGLIRKEPSCLGVRQWSTYSLLLLRLFNELDHEFMARLNRAYPYATQYMDSFRSKLFTIHVRNISGILGVIALYFWLWTVFQAVVIEHEYVITAGAIATCAVSILISLLPNENAIFVPEILMKKVVAQMHYMPDHWRDKTHTVEVRQEFSQLFQLRFNAIIGQLISPFIVPFVLFKLRSRALDMVDFFRSFTVEVAGVGDVCSFALMDISRHGNHEWTGDTETKADLYQQAENGKTELSLIHFTCTNPDWLSPPASSAFIQNLKEKAQIHVKELRQHGNENALYTSLCSLPNSVNKVMGLTDSVAQAGQIAMPVIKGSVNCTEGPLHFRQTGLYQSMCNESQDLEFSSQPQADDSLGHYLLDRRAQEISFNSSYLHELHHLRLQELRQPRTSTQQQQQQHESLEDQGDEKKPLLDPSSSSNTI